jgi:hypothetical protein
MYVSLPNSVLGAGVMSTEWLADDNALRSHGLHPGDEVGCPMEAESRPSGFPILRTGKIASYPLLPTAGHQDFSTRFSCISGQQRRTCLHYVRRVRNGSLVLSRGMAIVGLVSKEQIFANRIPLGIAEVVHATLIS